MFDFDKIAKVYSGRKGCACGCRGKYSYATTHKNARPDYMTDDDGVSDRAVRRITATVERAVRNGEAERIYIDPDFFAIDMPHDRTYTIYFAS